MSTIAAPAQPPHRDMIERNGGSAAVGSKIGEPANDVKAWKRLDSIPAPYWQRIADAEIATLEELAAAAAQRRAPAEPATAQA